MKTSRHFTLKELVPEQIFKEYGNSAWHLFDPRLIDTIDIIRDIFDLPITINNWCWGGKNQYRGYRPENCEIGAKKSAHKIGMAVDMTVKGIDAESARQKIKENKHLLPFNIRLEKNVDWVHVDVNSSLKNDKIIYFNA